MRNAELLSLTGPAIEQVRGWLKASQSARFKHIKRSPGERRLALLLKSEVGLEFAVRFVDRVVRTEDTKVAARELFALRRLVPSTLSFIDRLMIKVGAWMALPFGFVVIPIARARMRSLVGHLVADARPNKLATSRCPCQEAGPPTEPQLARRGSVG